MSKRIKQVFTLADQVLHLWANPSQHHARSRNVFFEGNKAYSYGYHYLLGVLHNIRGAKVAIINSTQYSRTTSKHQSYAKAAVSHYDAVIHSSDPENVEISLLETQEGLIEQLTDIFFRRNPYWDVKYVVLAFKRSLINFNYDQTHHELVFKIGCHDILKSEVERLFNTSKAGLV